MAGSSLIRRVLVLSDDEDLYRTALAADLEARGFTIRPAATILEAESLWTAATDRGEDPGLVVDIIQPAPDGGWLGGLDLLRRLRPGSSAQAVALVDSEAAWLGSAAQRLGATRLVVKPDLRRAEPEHLDRELHACAAAIAGERVPASSAASGPRADPLLAALEELQPDVDRSSLLLLLMRFAAGSAARGVLYDVDGDRLRPLGGFGRAEAAHPGGEPLPLDRDTLPGRAFWSGRMQRSRPPEAVALAPGLGGPIPSQALSVPVFGPGGVTAVLYLEANDEGLPPPAPRPLAALAAVISRLLEARAATPV